jgi:hypothetical protein
MEVSYVSPDAPHRVVLSPYENDNFVAYELTPDMHALFKFAVDRKEKEPGLNETRNLDHLTVTAHTTSEGKPWFGEITWEDGSWYANDFDMGKQKIYTGPHPAMPFYREEIGVTYRCVIGGSDANTPHTRELYG